MGGLVQEQPSSRTQTDIPFVHFKEYTEEIRGLSCQEEFYIGLGEDQQGRLWYCVELADSSHPQRCYLPLGVQREQLRPSHLEEFLARVITEKDFDPRGEIQPSLARNLNHQLYQQLREDWIERV